MSDVLEDGEHLLLWDDEIQEYVEAQPGTWARFFQLLLLSLGLGVGIGVVLVLMFVVAVAVFAGSAFLAVVVGSAS